MAATNPSISHKLAALSAAALALPGLAPEAQAGVALDHWHFDADYSFYEESANRMQVEVVQTGLQIPISDQFDFSINGVRDTISGASPIFNTPCQNTLSGGPSRLPRTGASSPPGRYCVGAPGKTRQIMSDNTITDVRDDVHMKLNYYNGDNTIGLGGGTSKEHDYNSDFVNAEWRREINNKLTTLAAGYSYASDDVSPSTQDFTKTKQSHQALLGVTQVLGKNTLWQGNVTYGMANGYMTDPYKFVWSADPLDLRGNMPHEKRPNQRQQWAMLSRFIEHFPSLNGAALHADYRFYVDTWDVHAHTLEATWIQPIADGWEITPHARYYSQDQAYFYHDYFPTLRNLSAYSSDYRLADFGAIDVGVKVHKEFFHALDVHGGYEYYFRRSDLALGGGKTGSFADYDFSLFSVGLTLKF